MRLRFLPAALLATAAVEVVVFVLLARWLGFGVTVLLTTVVSLLGLVLLRREGVRAWRGFQAAVADGRPPGDQLTDGLLGLCAGVLLAAPGLVTGLAGALLVLPPVRAVARRGVRAAAERRISTAAAGDLFGPRRVRVYPGQPSGSSGAGPAGASTHDDSASADAPTIEGEIVEPWRG